MLFDMFIATLTCPIAVPDMTFVFVLSLFVEATPSVACQRVTLHAGDYFQELSEDYAISDALSAVRAALAAAEDAAADVRGRFLDYGFLWTSDLNAALHVQPAHVQTSKTWMVHRVVQLLSRGRL